MLGTLNVLNFNTKVTDKMTYANNADTDQTAPASRKHAYIMLTP